MRPLVLAVMFATTSLACGKGASGSDAPGDAVDAGDEAGDGGLFGQRPYTLKVPPSYDATKPTPLLILLHGYSASGYLQDAYFGLTATSQAKGFLYVFADGTIDSKGKRFWNATDACCNFDDNPVDDVAYLNAIIDDVAGKYTVDTKRVFLVGHSNGGFMAHRFACDQASRVAAIVSLAGEVWKDPARCAPSEAVSVLQVHGDKDDTIPYDGGDTGTAADPRPFPSAHETVATWAAKDGCKGALTAAGTLDIDTRIAGAETKVERYDGCPTGIGVELWTVQGGSHIPSLPLNWGDMIYGFLSAHPKR
jgi:polyhydroxybutyrate depolymerase